jgi:hypothetical protein
MPVPDPQVTGAVVEELPEVVGGAVVVVLHHLGGVRSGHPVDTEDLARVDAADPHVTVAVVDELPQVIGGAGVAELDHAGAVRL